MYCIEYASKLLSCFQSYVEAVSHTSVLRSWALGVIASWGQSLIQSPYDKGKEELLPGLLPRDVTTQHQVTAFVFVVVLLVFDTGSLAAPTGLELLIFQPQTPECWGSDSPPCLAQGTIIDTQREQQALIRQGSCRQSDLGLCSFRNCGQ